MLSVGGSAVNTCDAYSPALFLADIVYCPTSVGIVSWMEQFAHPSTPHRSRAGAKEPRSERTPVGTDIKPSVRLEARWDICRKSGRRRRHCESGRTTGLTERPCLPGGLTREYSEK